MHTDHSLKNAENTYGGLQWSPLGGTLAAATLYYQGIITLWQPLDKPKQGVVNAFISPNKPTDTGLDMKPISDVIAQGICWSADGLQLLAYDQKFNIVNWDVKAGKHSSVITLPQPSLALPENPAQSGTFRFPNILRSPNAATQFAAIDVDMAIVFDAQQKKVLHNLGGNDPDTRHTFSFGTETDDPLCPQISRLAWSPNGRYLAGTYLGTPQIFVWDLQNPSPRLVSTGGVTGIQLPDLAFGKTGGHDKNEYILDLTWSPDGRYLASASTDTTVIIWKVDKVA